MALNSENLFNNLKSNVFDKQFENIDEYRVQIGKTISNYIQNNTEIVGVFTGMTNSSPSSPIAVSGTAKIICPDIIVPNGTTNMNYWWQFWCKTILQPAIVISCNNPLLGYGTIELNPLPITLPMDISNIKPIWQPICDSIIDTIKSAIIPTFSCQLQSPAATGVFFTSKIN